MLKLHRLKLMFVVALMCSCAGAPHISTVKDSERKVISNGTITMSIDDYHGLVNECDRCALALEAALVELEEIR